VFVALGEGKLQPREVVLGESDRGSVEVVSGLTEGENVVVRANFLVDSESQLRASLAALMAAKAGRTGGSDAERAAIGRRLTERAAVADLVAQPTCDQCYVRTRHVRTRHVRTRRVRTRHVRTRRVRLGIVDSGRAVLVSDAPRSDRHQTITLSEMRNDPHPEPRQEVTRDHLL
jgi:hypothetical protein